VLPNLVLLVLSNLASKVRDIEIDLSEEEASAVPSSNVSSVKLVGIRRLEEAIHGVMVRWTTPILLGAARGRRAHGVGRTLVPPLNLNFERCRRKVWYKLSYRR
jgi:hypothetical protein